MSERTEALREVVAALAPDLKAQGFRKRGRCFNRATRPGVVQVVGFQLKRVTARPGVPVPPALAAGSFTINLGVHIAALEPASVDWVSDTECQLRERIGGLLQDHDHDRRAVEPWSSKVDIWWSLADVGLAVDAVRAALRDFGMPWLERFSAEAAMTDQLEQDERIFTEARQRFGDNPSMSHSHPDRKRLLREWIEHLGVGDDAEEGRR